MNLYEETMAELNAAGYEPSDIKAVFGETYQIPIDNFLKLAKATDYDSNYGAQEVAFDLRILLNDGAWLERGEYDGKEWWQLRKSPQPPAEIRKIKHLAVFGGFVGWERLEDLNK